MGESSEACETQVLVFRIVQDDLLCLLREFQRIKRLQGSGTERSDFELLIFVPHKIDQQLPGLWIPCQQPDRFFPGRRAGRVLDDFSETRIQFRVNILTQQLDGFFRTNQGFGGFVQSFIQTSLNVFVFFQSEYFNRGLTYRGIRILNNGAQGR